MRTLKLTLAYDGGRYVGWQRQAAGRSIQGELERALADIERRPVTVHGAGRTDAGVHAVGQVASVRLAHPLAAGVMARALNAKLPDDIRVRRVDEADETFHARFSARRKTYRYHLATGPAGSPFTRGYAWQRPAPIDIAAVRAAGTALEGRHDFAAFQAAGAAVVSTIRTIHEVRVVAAARSPFDVDGPALTAIQVVGDGFLRHMVRIIVGTLLGVSHTAAPAAAIGEILASRRRSRAGMTAPAHGLFLRSVDY